MIRMAILLIGFSISEPVQEEKTTGFYVITSETEKKCPHKFETFNHQRFFCVPGRPILDKSAFSSVSEIKFEEKTKYIELNLTVKGMSTLKKLVTSLPNTQLVLVINNVAVGALRNKDVISTYIRIDGALDSPEIDWIREQFNQKQ